MSEFIGSRISLISKSDIRYVGILHEINSENSTVALEQVTSFGTEGRLNDPEKEIPGSDSVYEYIVFRGGDVKDLRIEEPPKETKPPPQPQVPNDPAILGSGSRPLPPQAQNQPTQVLNLERPPQYQQPPQNSYQQYGQYQNQRFGPVPVPQTGFPGPPGGFGGYPGMPYGGPGGAPGWQHLPGQGLPYQPGPFSPPQNAPFNGPPGQSPNQKQVNQQGPLPGTTGPQVGPQEKNGSMHQQGAAEMPAPKAQASQSTTPAQSTPTTKATPPIESKTDIAAALVPATGSQPGTLPTPKTLPTGPKSNPMVAMPLASPKVKTSAKATVHKPSAVNAGQAGSTKTGDAAASAKLQYQNATQAATAAVAAAMAKLPPAPGSAPGKAAQMKPRPEGDAMDNLTRKVNEMRTDDRLRNSRGPGTGNYAAGYRGSRGGGGRRGGREQSKGIEVPATDFDFETANAKFNKQDLVKEAIATGSPVGTPAGDDGADTNGIETSEGPSNGDVVIPPAGPSYNKSSSFFDNLSSETRDREESTEGPKKPSGQEFRSEERKKNMETFGLGSVDGYRGGRGRGRGRGGYSRGRGGSVQASGTGHRGRGGYRGGYRGASGSSVAEV